MEKKTPHETDHAVVHTTTPSEHIKIMGILHLIGCLLSLIFGGWCIFFPILYFVIKRDEFTPQEKQVFYNIINFNLTILVAFAASCVLLLALIGFLLIPVVVIAAFVIMILASIDHLQGRPYKFPLTIPIIK